MPQRPTIQAPGPDVPAIIVSADTHIGPLLIDQLREYCPRKYLQSFDEYASSWEAYTSAMLSAPGDMVEGARARAGAANRDSPGHHDMDARLAEMDADGVAAEVIFHASTNQQPIPFQPMSAHLGVEDAELASVGFRIYNRWLADACSVQPERQAGLVYLPVWDLEAAIKELEWGRDAGLRGVNFPAMRGELPPYNSRTWEPLWCACEALEMPLTTHGGRSAPTPIEGPEAAPLRIVEEMHVFGYRAIHWMVLAGVFERHPRLKLVMTEITGNWFSHYLAVIDEAWGRGAKWYPRFRAQVPRPASEYCIQNVYIGASFMAHFEAQAAVRDGYVDRIMWGSDYPHNEGTWQNGFDYHGETATRLALRNTFAGIPERELRQMSGETAAHVYGLDLAALQAVAARIQAPTPQQLSVPPSEIPEDLRTYTYAFRTPGTFT